MLKVGILKAHYYWAEGVNPDNNKRVIDGPHPTEDAADAAGAGLGSVYIHKLTTRDRTKASAIIRHRVKNRMGIRDAMRRFSHKKRGGDDKPKDFDDADPLDSDDEDDEL